jgi:hypothetical protein
MKGFEINDDPKKISNYKKYFFKEPMLLNINTNRLFWHSGAGQDDPNVFDRYKFEKKKLGPKADIIDLKLKENLDILWQRQLEKL